jgi:uncharacterized membrane protein YqiK
MDPIDRLLANLTPNAADQKDLSPKPAVQTPPADETVGSIEDLLKSLGESVKEKVRGSLRDSRAEHFPTAAPNLQNLQPVAEIEDYQQAQAAVAQADQAKQQEQARLHKQRQAALEQQRRQDLRVQAQAWLQKLDRKSAEGRWFEEFACHYESPLEAAIEYFLALQEVNSPLPSVRK